MVGCVPRVDGRQGHQISCGHWSSCSWGRANKTSRDVRVTNIMIDIIRLNWNCNITRSAQGNIYTCVTTELYNNRTMQQWNKKVLCCKCEYGSKW